MGRTAKLSEIETYVDEISGACPTMSDSVQAFPSLGESDGDACLFNGLLSTVDVQLGTATVLRCQAPPGSKKHGMFYRSPLRRATDNSGYEAFFSRDMACGVLAAYATPFVDSALDCQFKLSAQRWMYWINHNRACAIKKPKWLGGGCAIRSPMYRYAPDDRSDITPTMWALMGRVWRHKDWEESPQMKKYAGCDGDISIIEAEKCDLGYPLHLKVVQAYIKFLLWQSRKYSMRVGEIAHERLPENLFYEFVAKRTITDDMIDRYLEMKPPVDQKWGHSWLWEKSEVTHERINKSCGWDFVFMGKLILRYA